ncbi:MAG: hypothetical protein M0021_01845 [Clostridia bacterium]|nr:hypothetical protein [Clostridia bacterium]
MNIKFVVSDPHFTSKQMIKELIKEVEIFCACGIQLHKLSFDESVTCPECGREYHLQEGTGHFHIIVNKPTEGTLLPRDF